MCDYRDTEVQSCDNRNLKIILKIVGYCVPDLHGVSVHFRPYKTLLSVFFKFSRKPKCRSCNRNSGMSDHDSHHDHEVIVRPTPLSKITKSQRKPIQQAFLELRQKYAAKSIAEVADFLQTPEEQNNYQILRGEFFFHISFLTQTQDCISDRFVCQIAKSECLRTPNKMCCRKWICTSCAHKCTKEAIDNFGDALGMKNVSKVCEIIFHFSLFNCFQGPSQQRQEIVDQVDQNIAIVSDSSSEIASFYRQLNLNFRNLIQVINEINNL